MPSRPLCILGLKMSCLQVKNYLNAKIRCIWHIWDSFVFKCSMKKVMMLVKSAKIDKRIRKKFEKWILWYGLLHERRPIYGLNQWYGPIFDQTGWISHEPFFYSSTCPERTVGCLFIRKSQTVSIFWWHWLVKSQTVPVKDFCLL